MLLRGPTLQTLDSPEMELAVTYSTAVSSRFEEPGEAALTVQSDVSENPSRGAHKRKEAPDVRPLPKLDDLERREEYLSSDLLEAAGGDGSECSGNDPKEGDDANLSDCRRGFFRVTGEVADVLKKLRVRSAGLQAEE